MCGGRRARLRLDLLEEEAGLGDGLEGAEVDLRVERSRTVTGQPGAGQTLAGGDVELSPGGDGGR